LAKTKPNVGNGAEMSDRIAGAKFGSGGSKNSDGLREPEVTINDCVNFGLQHVLFFRGIVAGIDP
jgi:hypothetical protein